MCLLCFLLLLLCQMAAVAVTAASKSAGFAEKVMLQGKVPPADTPQSAILEYLGEALSKCTTLPELTGRVLASAVFDVKESSVTISVRGDQSEDDITAAVSNLKLTAEAMADVVVACGNEPVTCLLCSWTDQPLAVRVIVFE